MTTSCHALGICQLRADCADYPECSKLQPPLQGCVTYLESSLPRIGQHPEAAHKAACAIQGPFFSARRQRLLRWRAWAGTAALALATSAVLGLLLGLLAARS
ncbi:MAG: hypothetical protein ACKVOO_12510 [Burkholderiaceae bacterium]